MRYLIVLLFVYFADASIAQSFDKAYPDSLIKGIATGIRNSVNGFELCTTNQILKFNDDGDFISSRYISNDLKENIYSNYKLIHDDYSLAHINYNENSRSYQGIGKYSANSDLIWDIPSFKEIINSKIPENRISELSVGAIKELGDSIVVLLKYLPMGNNPKYYGIYVVYLRLDTGDLIDLFEVDNIALVDYLVSTQNFFIDPNYSIDRIRSRLNEFIIKDSIFELTHFIADGEHRRIRWEREKVVQIDTLLFPFMTFNGLEVATRVKDNYYSFNDGYYDGKTDVPCRWPLSKYDENLNLIWSNCLEYSNGLINFGHKNLYYDDNGNLYIFHKIEYHSKISYLELFVIGKYDSTGQLIGSRRIYIPPGEDQGLLIFGFDSKIMLFVPKDYFHKFHLISFNDDLNDDDIYLMGNVISDLNDNCNLDTLDTCKYDVNYKIFAKNIETGNSYENESLWGVYGIRVPRGQYDISIEGYNSCSLTADLSNIGIQNDTLFHHIYIRDNTSQSKVIPPGLHKIEVYPNPSSGLIQVKAPFPVRQIEVYDLFGKRVLQDYSMEIHLDQKGLFILHVSDGRRWYSEKVLIQ